MLILADSQAFHRARQHARNEMAERIATDYPFSFAQVWLVVGKLSEAEARQVCTLARRWEVSPIATCAVLEEQTDDIHAVLARLRTKPRRYAGQRSASALLPTSRPSTYPEASHALTAATWRP